MATIVQVQPRPSMPGRSDDSMIMGRIVPISTPTIQTFAPSLNDCDLMDISTPTSSLSRDLSNFPASMASSSTPDPAGRSDLSKTPSPIDSVKPSFLSTSIPLSTPPPAIAGAGAAIHQPKIVQTAFIHKLYNMLEDHNIQNLISWSSGGESFVMSPSAEFSRVLAQYFKHTNISSFVRQLNMYGFHKVSDVFHSSSPDTALWEFKHGSGNFKRGDITALREIKRRASRHSLVHRDYTNQKPISTALPVAEALTCSSDGPEGRITAIEHLLYDVSARLQKSEDNANYLFFKYHGVAECTSRILQFSSDLCRGVLGAAISNSDSPIYREVRALQGEIQRQADIFHNVEDSLEQPVSGMRPYYANYDNAFESPRKSAQDDGRRPNLAVPSVARGSSTTNSYRPQIPSALAVSTRRPYGSIGAASPVISLRAGPPPPPTLGLHPPLAVESLGGMPRRHTSADIRAQGWQAVPSSFGASGPSLSTLSGPSSGPWPPSPNRRTAASEEQRIRDSLSLYSLQTASQPRTQSSPITPPQPTYMLGTGSCLNSSHAGSAPSSTSGAAASHASDNFGGWSWNNVGHTEGKATAPKDALASSERRGSVAHLLNPTDAADRNSEDDSSRGEDDRKRKRLQ